jgi:uroporphyrinogen-III synthase
MGRPSRDSSISVKKLSDLTPDKRNANKGSARGNAMIQKSLAELGAGRSILLDKHGAIIAGNKTAENFGALGNQDVLVVQTDGTRLVAVQRMDLDLADPKAIQLACEKTRRKCFMMELSEAYCDVIVTRWQNATGGKAVLHGRAAQKA